MNALILGLTLAASGSLSADVQLRSGYDSNIYYDSIHALSSPNGQGPAADAFLRLTPRVEATLLAGPLRLSGHYDLLYTQYGSYAHGYAFFQRVILAEELRLGAVMLGLFQLGEQYAISAFPSDRFFHGALGASAGLRLGTTELGARIEYGPRGFPGRDLGDGSTERDGLLTGALVARGLLGKWSWSGALTAEHRGSNLQPLQGQSLGAEASLGWRSRVLELTVGGGLRRLWLSDFPFDEAGDLGRRDTQLSGSAQVTYAFGAWLPGVAATWERGISNYGPGSYHRFEAGLLLGYRWSGSIGPARSSHVTSAAPGQTRLSVKLPKARRVSVVGTFNGWHMPGLPLSERAPGEWEIEISVAPGRYRYQLVVDGERQAPPEAEAYEPDGMGGLDGVFTVSRASSSPEDR